MSYLKITEKTTTSTVKSSASVLITQPETNDVESLRRASLSALADALIAEGITSAIEVSTGTSVTLADNTEYRLSDVATLTITYPEGNFECWFRITTAASGTVTITFPVTTSYIGTAPTFSNSETWEMSIKDGVVIAAKVGDGT